MILRIYWTAKYQRESQGFHRADWGIKYRLAKQYGVSIDVIKHIVRMKESLIYRRGRFPTVNVNNIKNASRARVLQKGKTSS